MDGELSRVRKGKIQDRAGTEVSDGNSDDASGYGKNEALNQHLADQYRAGSTKRGANRGLGAATGSARQEKVGDVRTRHEQDEC
jgi:hypothetical protein